MVDPHLNGAGGEAPILLWDEQAQQMRAINGQGCAPAAASPAAFRALGLELVPGIGLTVNLDVTTAQDPPGEIRLRRAWSSQPEAYPVGGGKTKTRTAWTRQLLEQRQVFVGEGDAALARVFDDHVRIASLGLRAVVNVPLLRLGRCVATFNVLGTEPRWQPGHVAAVRLLALLATPHVLPGPS